MEVLISLVVLGLILVGILSVFVFSSRQGSFLRRRLQAIDFARETLETLKNQVRADSWSTGGLTVGTHATAAEDLPVGTELKDTWSGTRMYSVDAGVGDTRKVTVTVQWNEP